MATHVSQFTLPGKLDIRKDDPLALPCHVTVMLDDRAYGGPEEGGWWYDLSYQVEHHYCATPTAFIAVMRRMARCYDNEGRREISSVLSDGLYCIWVGQEIPESFPACRPHYE
jgi:hypothetical protein